MKMHTRAILQRLRGAEQRDACVQHAPWLRNRPGGARTIPRLISSRSIPARFNAVRCPATARSICFRRQNAARVRARRFRGRIKLYFVLTFTAPEISVPVTTVPNPFIANARSIGNRKFCVASFLPQLRAAATQRLLQFLKPRARRALTATIGAPSRNDPRTNSSISSRTKLQRVGIHQIGFRNRDNSARNSQQPANVKVLARLRLDRFVRRDHQQHQIDPADARQHVPHKSLVPRHIHQPQPSLPELQKRESQVNRDAAPFFFFQAVGVRAGERLDQRGFAVVDVSSGADNDVLDGLHGNDGGKMLSEGTTEGQIKDTDARSARLRGFAILGSVN